MLRLNDREQSTTLEILGPALHDCLDRLALKSCCAISLLPVCILCQCQKLKKKEVIDHFSKTPLGKKKGNERKGHAIKGQTEQETNQHGFGNKKRRGKNDAPNSAFSALYIFFYLAMAISNDGASAANGKSAGYELPW